MSPILARAHAVIRVQIYTSVFAIYLDCPLSWNVSIRQNTPCSWPLITTHTHSWECVQSCSYGCARCLNVCLSTYFILSCWTHTHTPTHTHIVGAMFQGLSEPVFLFMQMCNILCDRDMKREFACRWLWQCSKTQSYFECVKRFWHKCKCLQRKSAYMNELGW